MKMSSNVISVSFDNLRGHFSGKKASHATATLQTAIRPCRKEDLPRIAEIHKAQFLLKGSLLGRLSPALIGAFYGAFLDRSIFLVHTSDSEVDGFVLGGPSRAMVNCKLSFLRKHALFCLADIARRPHLWLRAFRSLLNLTGHWMPSSAPSEEFRMLSIAVAARATRKGVGTALVQGFEAALRTVSRTYRLNVLKINVAGNPVLRETGFPMRRRDSHCVDAAQGNGGCRGQVWNRNPRPRQARGVNVGLSMLLEEEMPAIKPRCSSPIVWDGPAVGSATRAGNRNLGRATRCRRYAPHCPWRVGRRTCGCTLGRPTKAMRKSWWCCRWSPGIS